MSDRQQGPRHTFPNVAKLRKRAEEKAGDMAPASLSVQTPEAIKQMVHELRVHQIELTMQNEELRRAYAEIEASQTRYFDLYDLAPVGYITVSKKGLILETNLTAATLMGLPRSTMVKQPLTQFILKEDQDFYYHHRKNLFETGEPQICELRLVKPDGRIFWAHLTATAAEGPNGTTVCRVVLNNITDRKQAEAEKEKLQTELNQAQKMESVGRLAGGVAHDFNNMLGVILGHTELALEKAEENLDLYDDLNEIQKAAQRSAKLTRQLLTFARKDIISPKQLDLNDTVESMLNMLRRIIGEDIDLVWQPASDMWPVKMDPSQIDQILVNLCINARDAIAGVGKLTIETGRFTFDEEYCNEHSAFIPGDFVLLAVNDNGCGMDKGTLDNLYEPFFTTKEVGKGTGLGLATIYGIVKQNNGFITVYTELGQGSTFKIYLPRFFTDEKTDMAVPEKEAAAGGTQTILLVDDEPSILRMTRMMLERKGYTLLSAATPSEAMEKAKEHPGSIHLFMSDVVMPEMNGRDLAEKMKALHPDIRLLFMSGYTADMIAHQGVLDAGVAFIQKPFSMADMTEKVRKVLDSAPDKIKND